MVRKSLGPGAKEPMGGDCNQAVIQNWVDAPPRFGKKKKKRSLAKPPLCLCWEGRAPMGMTTLPGPLPCIICRLSFLLPLVVNILIYLQKGWASASVGFTLSSSLLSPAVQISSQIESWMLKSSKLTRRLFNIYGYIHTKYILYNMYI